MSASESVATFAVLIVVVSIVTAVAAGACALFRVRRIAAVAVLLASLLPAGVGLLGVIFAQIRTYQTIECLAAPTPDDLAPFSSQGARCVALGTCGTILSALLGFAALARSRADSAVTAPEDVRTDED